MNPGVPHYNFKTSPDENLALNEYYFVCDYSAHFLKTKNKEMYPNWARTYQKIIQKIWLRSYGWHGCYGYLDDY